MESVSLPWYVERGMGPLVAVALHDGHALRPGLAEQSALSPDERLREEDPFTGSWTSVAPTRLIALHSRFEVDLNRPPESAVYQTPEQAWGLQVWRRPLSRDTAAHSLAIHGAFFDAMRELLEGMVSRYRHVVVLDLHSYNHRRQGPDAPPADPHDNPEVNVGTGTMDRAFWSTIVDRFIADMRHFDFLGRHLDVRENIRFRGGYFPQWVHENFPQSVCVLAIEFKKFFMDEWTGQPDRGLVGAIERALKSTVWGIHEELVRLGLPPREIPA